MSKTIQDREPNFRNEAGELNLVRCFACNPNKGIENYGPEVATGQCAWCGWDDAADGEPEPEPEPDSSIPSIDPETLFVIGCIGHDGAITGRAHRADGQGSSMHTEAESRGKRWRWHYPDQRFMGTLDDARRQSGYAAPDALTPEESLRVVDWLIRQGYAFEALYEKYAEALRA